MSSRKQASQTLAELAAHVDELSGNMTKVARILGQQLCHIEVLEMALKDLSEGLDDLERRLLSSRAPSAIGAP